MSNTRARGTIVTKLDLSKVKADALPFVQKQVPEATGVSFRQTDYAVAEVGRKLFVIGTEGVGEEVTPFTPFEVEVYAEVPNSISILPCAILRLKPAEVRKAATGPKVDLADFIRTFGARLERNFDIWRNTLKVAA